jgi:hypothetical protein
VSIVSNSVGGIPQCYKNYPAPEGSGNFVEGNMEGQCAYFGGYPPPLPPPEEDYHCTGFVGAISVDNLRVPPDATCKMIGNYVGGNIFVDSDATLLADNVQVDGNIQAEYATRVNVYPGSSVGGNI